MKNRGYVWWPLLILTSCSSLPALYQDVEEIATDDAVQVIVSREAITKGTDLDVNVTVKNSQLPTK